jgi:small conductance mechanosensitive channel
VSAQRTRRVDLEFGIGYSDDMEKAERILGDIIGAYELVLKSPEPIIKLHTLGDSLVNFLVRPWVKTRAYWDVYWDITRELKRRFDREEFSIPFTQRDAHLYQESV